MPLPSSSSFFGISKEVTKGTGVPATAFIPWTTFTPVDTILYLEDKAMRGAAVDVYNEIAGPIYSTIACGGPVFADTFPWVVAGLLGDLVTTGATAPFSHAISTKNSGDFQPGSKSITDFYGIAGTNSRQFTGAQFSDLALKFDATGMLEWTGSCTAFASALVTKPTQSFTTIPPYASWVGTTNIGGSAITKLEIGEIDVKRPVSVIHSVDGTQAPYGIWVGPVSVTGKLTLVHEDDSELIRYLTNTQPSLTIDFTTGAAAALTEVKAQMTICAYVVANIVRGKDYVQTDVTFTAIANSTDVGASGGYSPIKFTCQNAVAASVYA